MSIQCDDIFLKPYPERYFHRSDGKIIDFTESEGDCSKCIEEVIERHRFGSNYWNGSHFSEIRIRNAVRLFRMGVRISMVHEMAKKKIIHFNTYYLVKSLFKECINYTKESYSGTIWDIYQYIDKEDFTVEELAEDL